MNIDEAEADDRNKRNNNNNSPSLKMSPETMPPPPKLPLYFEQEKENDSDRDKNEQERDPINEEQRGQYDRDDDREDNRTSSPTPSEQSVLSNVSNSRRRRKNTPFSCDTPIMDPASQFFKRSRPSGVVSLQILTG